MKYKLAIANVVTFAVVGRLDETPTTSKKFNFQLTCDLLNQEEMQKVMQDKEQSIKEFLLGITKGWRDQRLVLNEDDSPADFNEESYAVMLSMATMPMYIYQAYVAAISVKSKNS